ncbi:MAG: HNH endonuclease signature motif containing protein [bacterium]|nr:HNH endonuclease signature motif containing protein [bacterium]
MDHVISLCAGGRDDPSNMQLLPKSVHKAKTKRDLASCARRRR